MSSVDAIQKMMDTYGLKAADKSGQNDLNKDAFLSLLVTQMQYQDPLQPTKNEDFLAQMAQFSSLEQMQNMNSSMTMQQGYNLVGKKILGSFVNSVSKVTEQVVGVVEAVTRKSGETYLRVDGKDVKLSAVEAVLNDTAQTQESKDIAEALKKMNTTLEGVNKKLDTLIKNTAKPTSQS